MRNVFLVLIFVIGQIFSVVAQEDAVNYWNADIINLFSKSDKNDFRKLKLKNEKAENLMVFADDSYQQIAELRGYSDQESDETTQQKMLAKALSMENAAIQSRKEALNLFNEVHVAVSEIYHKYLTKSENKELEILQGESVVCFDKASQLRKKAYYTANEDLMFATFIEAYNKEMEGLFLLKKGFLIELNADAEEMKSVQHEINFYGGHSEIEENNEVESETELTESSDENIDAIEEAQEVPKTVDAKDQIFFKIQIAASKKAMSVDELLNIYDSKEMISSEIENGWYKYNVGKFDNYQKAQRFKLSMGVSDAFIVAYKNHKKIAISDELKEM